MTLGERLAHLRKKQGYTQEQLAELLEVSRQAVSKWESDGAYPETEKLIRLGQLYGCSMDYLLKGETSESTQQATSEIKIQLSQLHFERKSKRTIRGLPLWHVNIGLGRTATGVLAVGFFARGVLSVGVFSMGLLSLGLFSVGLLAFGVLALGFLAAGAFAAGILAFGAVCAGILACGAISIGLFAVGAIAVGQSACGALALGNYFAIGDEAHAAIAIGKTIAVGTVYQASAITAENRQVIIDLLDQSIPPLLAWLKVLTKLLL